MKGMWCNSITPRFTLDWYGSLKPQYCEEQRGNYLCIYGICCYMWTVWGLWTIRNNGVYWSCRIHSVSVVYLWLALQVLIQPRSHWWRRQHRAAGSFQVFHRAHFHTALKVLFAPLAVPLCDITKRPLPWHVFPCHLFSGELCGATGTSPIVDGG